MFALAVCRKLHPFFGCIIVGDNLYRLEPELATLNLGYMNCQKNFTKNSDIFAVRYNCIGTVCCSTAFQS